MATRTYAQLLDDIEGLAGVSSFTASEQANILGFVNKRLYQAYSASELWPRYLVEAEARPALDNKILKAWPGGDDGSAFGVYSTGTPTRNGTTVNFDTFDQVLFVPGMLVNVQSTGGSVNITGQWPVTETSGIDLNTATWEVTFQTKFNTGTDSYSSLYVYPSALTEINRAIRVFGGNPNVSSQTEYEFYEEADGIRVIDPTPGKLNTWGGDSSSYSYVKGYWVQYQKAWDGPYTTQATNIPLEFYYYAVHGAYADFLRMDGQNDKAIAAEANAEVYLTIELNKAALSANARRYSRTSTHLSRQSRL